MLRKTAAHVVAVFVVLLCGVMPVWAKEVVVAGSGSCLAIVHVLASEFARIHPEIRFSIPASIGSAGGIKAAADGAIEIGVVSRPLKDDEARLGLVYQQFAQAIVVLAVNQNVVDRDIKSTELSDIYRGIKTSWKNGPKIIVLTREPQDSSIMILRNNIPGFGAAYDFSWRKKLWATLFTYQEMNDYLSKTPNSIGISDLGSIAIEKLKVRPLRIDGIEPDIRAVKNGSYSLVLPYAFVYRAKHLSTEARTFLDFVSSAQGKKILSKYNYM